MSEVTVMEHLGFHAKLRLFKMNAEQRKQRILDVLKRLRLTSSKDTIVTKLSGGQKKRVIFDG